MALPPIITLTTDFGYRDHYAASLKGTLLRLFPGIQLVDVTHGITPFNYMEAAFILRSAFPKFPEGSIHLIGVDAEGGARQNTLIMEYGGHLFLAPDNGVLSLIKGAAPGQCYRVDHELLPPLSSGRSFLAQMRLAPVAAMLASGKTPSELGELFPMRESLWGEPSLIDGSMRGVIQHIDRFGNAITNIHRDAFMEAKGDRSFEIFIRNVRIQRIVTTYGDVGKGDAMAIFSENDYLELAIREGSAAQLLGLKVQDMLTIEFRG